MIRGTRPDIAGAGRNLHTGEEQFVKFSQSAKHIHWSAWSTMSMAVVLNATLALPIVSAQLQGDANVFTEAAFVDSPEIARDRDWLFNYLSAGKSIEQSENIRTQVDRMSVSHVRSLLRYYQQKQDLAQQREDAVKGTNSDVLAAERLLPIAPQMTDAAQREATYELESRRTGFQWNPYMFFPFNPLPIQIDLIDDPIPY